MQDANLLPFMPARARAHPNIALIKYWGKRDVALNLPAVGSLSLTLDTWHSTTEVIPDAQLDQDEVTLDGRLLTESQCVMQRHLLNLLRARAERQSYVRVHTNNNFPTGAGLASSASGFAALTVAAAKTFGITATPTELSRFARQGSGSAARSLFGGWAEMAHGASPSGEDAVATSILSEDAWPMRVVVAIVNREQKAVSSTRGMQATQLTSPYWDAWVSHQAEDLQEAHAAIASRDFFRLAAVSEHSCLKMHALMLAARPALKYWRPATYAALSRVTELRQQGLPCFFTIDAGPQLKAICLPEAADQVAHALRDIAGVHEVVQVGLGGPAHLLPHRDGA